MLMSQAVDPCWGHLVGEEVGVDAGVHRHEGFTKASRKGGLGLFDTDFCTGDLGGVARDEVVGSL